MSESTAGQPGATDGNGEHASARRFHTLFAHAPFSVQLIDKSGRTLQVNDAWKALWVEAADPALLEHVLSGAYNILADPQLREKGILAFLERAFAGESVRIPPALYDPAEMNMPGRARWVQASAHPIRDDEGEVREVMLMHEDVSERIEAERALRASEQRLTQLANTIPQLAWITDPQGNGLWYNDRWYEYTGASVDEMRGQGWQRVHDPDVLPLVLPLWEHALRSGQPFEMSFPLRARDGSYRPFLTLVAPLKDASGAILQWFGTNTDISTQQRTERELRAAEERLRLATDAGAIGIWEWEMASNRVIWSERVYELHGVTPESFDGSVDAYTRLLDARDRDMLWHKVEQAIEQKTGYSAEFRACLPDGSTRWLSTWARVQTNERGMVERLIGATISIDSHKMAEQALVDNNRRKDEFLAMLAHELRNPLAPISAAAQILRLPGLDDVRVRQTSEVIGRQVGHMAKLIDDLMDVSRVTRGLVELERTPQDLKAIVNSAIEQVRPLMEARQHTLSIRIGSQPAGVVGDRTRLIQIVTNLLNNAAKYTPPGGEIGLRVEVRAPQVVITVEDNGNGIDAELLPHVFELFTQGQRSLDRSQGGLGIGLALVRSLVTMHGGQVEVHSSGTGQGSCFVVRLPLSAHLVAGEGTSESPMAALPAPRRVAVVDDNLDAAHSLALLLEAMGHEVRVYGTAADVLEASEAWVPDVFILDIGLPDLDGYELARRLHARPGLSHTRMLALTGYGQPHDRARSKAAGILHHFVKPVDLMQLAAALGEHEPLATLPAMAG